MKLVAKFTRTDWLTVVLCAIFILLTLVPLLPFVKLTDPWFFIPVLSLGAIALSTIILSQIASRESDNEITIELRSLQGLVASAVDRSAVHEVPSSQIGSELDALLRGSSEWYFRGGSARWQREAVLPRLARITDRPVQYKVQVISPFEAELCDKYALYRKKSQPGDPRGDSHRIRLELLAFIYATVVWQSRSKITADITLLHRFSPFRLDGNSNSFIITVADITKNGLRTQHGNWYHSSLLDEFEFEAGYATRLVLPAEADDANGWSDVESFFNALRVLNPVATSSWQPNFGAQEWGSIFNLAKTTTNDSA